MLGACKSRLRIGVDEMSEAPVGLIIAEKFFGLVAMIIGALTVFYTYVSPPDSPPAVPSGWLSSIFIVAGFVLIGIGVFLMLAKAE
jgi:predicted phage tail protein